MIYTLKISKLFFPVCALMSTSTNTNLFVGLVRLVSCLCHTEQRKLAVESSKCLVLLIGNDKVISGLPLYTSEGVDINLEILSHFMSLFEYLMKFLNFTILLFSLTFAFVASVFIFTSICSSSFE